MYSTFAPVDLQPGEELDPREGHEVAGGPAEDAAGDDAPGDRAVRGGLVVPGGRRRQFKKME